MFKTFQTLLRGGANRAEDALIDANAALILEQKIREAESGHDDAKRTLARIIVRRRDEERALETVRARIKDLEKRTRLALKADHQELARDGARHIADLENEERVRVDAVDGLDRKAQRLKLAIEKTERQIVELRQGLVTAQAITAERRATDGLSGAASSAAAIREARAVMERVSRSADPIEEFDVLDDLDRELSGEAVVDRMADAGFGAARRVRGEDVLKRLGGPAAN
jgi:phage shock protein A